MAYKNKTDRDEYAKKYRLLNRADLSHITGAVREGLCKRHNVGLGMFDDDPSCLKKAIAYLMKHKKKP